MAGGIASYPVRSPYRNVALAAVRVTANGTSDPTSYSDPAGVVSAYARTGVGTIKLTLRESWTYVFAVANALDATAGVGAKVVSVTQGSGTCSVTIQTEAESAGVSAAADLTGKDVHIMVVLMR